MTTDAANTKMSDRPRRGRLLLGLSLCIVVIVTCNATYNGFTLFEWWRDLHSGVVLSHASTSEKVVALTFDDGPDPTYTPRVLDTLHHYSVHATFFDQGRQIQKYPLLVRRTVAEGHCIGNHTYSHPYLTRLTPKAVRNEMEACDRCLKTDVGIKTALFRSPRGDWNPMVYRQTVQDHKYLVLWTIALEHHDIPTPQAMAQRVLQRVRPGDIILMHDGAFVSREATVQALPILIEGLQKRGYRCVTVPALLHLPATTVLSRR
ncbi:MAG: polysaccharide deacetylase [Chthonomonadaceae bacterium]|nr:polysaccharide deacetylase [Chthonomonadaceae bacterium]